MRVSRALFSWSAGGWLRRAGLVLLASRVAWAPVTYAQGAPAAARSVRWMVGTLPHLDLWLHSFALLSNDSAQAPTVPLYRRGYRDSLTAVRQRANVLTGLDGNQAALVEGLGKGAGYLNAQFLPFEFDTWEDLRRSAEQFGQLRGDLTRAASREMQQRLLPFANLFPTAADREWLRLFLAAIGDERQRWFDAEYARVAAERRGVVAAVDRLWQQVAGRFERFLTNSGQRQGEIVLSLPLGGEGRTTTLGATATRPAHTRIAVPFPVREADAAEAIHVLAHELTGTLVGPVVSDHVTPAEVRSGVAARYTSRAQVIAGALLLERVAPDLRAGYQRYYLVQVGVPVADASAADVAVRFDQTFVVPAALRHALVTQLDLVLGGI